MRTLQPALGVRVLRSEGTACSTSFTLLSSAADVQQMQVLVSRSRLGSLAASMGGVHYSNPLR